MLVKNMADNGDSIPLRIFLAPMAITQRTINSIHRAQATMHSTLKNIRIHTSISRITPHHTAKSSSGRMMQIINRCFNTLKT